MSESAHGPKLKRGLTEDESGLSSQCRILLHETEKDRYEGFGHANEAVRGLLAVDECLVQDALTDKKGRLSKRAGLKVLRLEVMNAPSRRCEAQRRDRRERELRDQVDQPTIFGCGGDLTLALSTAANYIRLTACRVNKDRHLSVVASQRRERLQSSFLHLEDAALAAERRK